MRDPKRIIRITDKFKALWALAPDMRFIQLVHGIMDLRLDETDGRLQGFMTEDDKFEAKLDETIKQLSTKP